MRPDIKYGLIGGIVFTLVLVTGSYFVEPSVQVNMVLVYLRELVLIVSVIAAIKVTRDRNKSELLELRAGLKAGLTAVVVICAFIFVFNFLYLRLMPEEEFAANNEVFYKAYFEREPVKDTSAEAYAREIARYDSSMKEKNIMWSSLSIRKAKLIRPSDTSLNAKIKEVDHMMFEKTRETGFVMKNIFFSNVFPQIVMGLLISFVTTMLFRYRQQAEM